MGELYNGPTIDIRMTLERQRLHTRSVEFNGYRRPDGLYDIEAELRDSRHYDTQVAEKAT
jgi:hypothetical protein